ncbi:MAG: cupredoxin domain-containing protein [Nanoarchaeota archaeon]
MKKIIAVFILAMIVLAGFLIIKNFTGNSIKTEVKEFSVEAFRFGYSPDIITVNKGDKVRIKIENTDAIHGIRIPELELRNNEIIEFTADKIGEFNWYCNTFCGNGHMEMGGKLIIK